ncbi:hypothetical protein P175DRAFT_0534146 [Aspergillus ochraceoroseus IBT 24754]|uniref:Uncharacterized protein n=1 Tax=Aspergillus ochraceoroseus IBT 24754 TaxID=1392256 RepID=A0A2T5LTT0_9EURO|nr:uncharacterized protein P175DRAFT_0534146 [Aspergillus ochraceoroseus IBT 24754]PTU19692.1 hypothetical protein P175DRAFT_0534146 [Aspergillus ochraceoroseus IBT 24754]
MKIQDALGRKYSVKSTKIQAKGRQHITEAGPDGRQRPPLGCHLFMQTQRARIGTSTNNRWRESDLPLSFCPSYFGMNLQGIVNTTEAERYWAYGSDD